VKPVGSLCNLDCTYCYYRAKGDLLQDEMGGSMTDDLLEEFIRQYITGQDAPMVIFTWHGGEPALLGLDFYEKAVRLQQKHAGGKRIENDLQTNGLGLDDAWGRFLKRHNFLVGLSIDGPKHLHDRFRVDKGGKPTFDRVVAAAELLRRYDIVFNAMTVVNAVNADYPGEVYRFLTRELGCQRLQWLPCVERKEFRTVPPGYWDPAMMPALGSTAAKPGQRKSVVTEWSVAPEAWGDFLCETFDLWFHNDRGQVLVTWFESLAAQWSGRPPQVCALAHLCGRSPVVEKDGSVYACDHFVYPEYKLGNLAAPGCSLGDLIYSARQRRFGCDKRDRLPKYCRQCSFRLACHGECPKNRFIKTPDGEAGLNYLCSGLKHFLAHADPYFRRIVAVP
jgi:uncharacterized protein